MNRRSVIVLSILLIFSIALVSTGVYFWQKIQSATDDPLGDVFKIIALINAKYPEKVNTWSLWKTYLKTGRIKNMLDTLKDPYTHYLTAKEYADFKQDIDGSFYGIGVLLNPEGDYPKILKVFPGTPGEKAGVKQGDEILSINGKDAYKMAGDLVAQKIRGPAGTTVVLKIRRKVAQINKTVEISIVRDRIEIPPMDWQVLKSPYNYKIGYILLYGFNGNASKYVDKALREFASQNIQGLILDLRINPGGLLEEAVFVSSYFLPPGKPVVHIIQKNEKPLTRYTLPLKRKDWPLVVLVSENSASASEIVAGALKDHGAATLVGEKTYGKGVVQEIIPLNGANGSALYLTIARYLTAGGHSINKEGIQPDIHVPLPVDSKLTNDPQKEKAIAILEEKISRAITRAS